MDYRVLDLNGNTILIRLIEQNNLYAITELLKKQKILTTYKNSVGETPKDYLIKSFENIQKDYNSINFTERIKKYSTTLDNNIKSNEQFNYIQLDNSFNLVYQTIMNSIYIFNEIMWFKNYSFYNEWTNDDKIELMSILSIKNETLLINTFDENDNKLYNEFNNGNKKTVIEQYENDILEEIRGLTNKKNELLKNNDKIDTKKMDAEIEKKIIY